jgi:hypothetical protein
MVEQAKADLDGAFEVEVPTCSLSIPGRIARPEGDSLVRFVRDPNARQGASPPSKSPPQRTAVGKARAGWGTPKAAGGGSGWSSPTALASAQRRAPVQGAINTALPSDVLTAAILARETRSVGSPEGNPGLPDAEVGQIVVGTDDVEIEPGEVSVSPGLKPRLSIEPAAFTFDFVDGSKLRVSDPHCVDLCAPRALAVTGSHCV